MMRATDPAARALARCAPLALCLVLCACAAPLIPYSADTPPLVLAPTSLAGVQDKRARFREIYCAVLEERGRELPDYRPCEDALTRVGAEPAGTGRPVDLGPSRRRLVAVAVPGVGYECLEAWLQPPGTVAKHVGQFGYERSGSRSTRCRAAGTTRARFATRSWPCRRRPPRRASSCSAIRRAPDILEAVANDSQLIFYDQIVPGSVLMGYLNADHLAVAVPINRTHTTIAAIAVTENAYPREALLEALVRFVEEDMAMTPP